jgi:hypothetical protein
MKRFKTFLTCVRDQIKKKFFKVQNHEISHACESLKEMAEEVTSIEELKSTEEYALSYNTTTRWQTL